MTNLKIGYYYEIVKGEYPNDFYGYAQFREEDGSYFMFEKMIPHPECRFIIAPNMNGIGIPKSQADRIKEHNGGVPDWMMKSIDKSDPDPIGQLEL